MDFEGRKELFRALFGSYNYNLNTETSDKDYKVFVAPTFDDLYNNKQFSKSSIGVTEDLDCHDIRKIQSLWWKGNISFLEVLYSEEIRLNHSLSEETKRLIHTFFRYKKEIATMNLPALYNSCIGMHIAKKNRVDKGTEGTKHLVEKYGYDTKEAMHSIRLLDFIRNFAIGNFENLEFAIKYQDKDDFKELLLDIKNGLYTKEQYIKIADNILNEVESKYKTIYLNKIPNKKLNEELIGMVKDIVKIELY